MKPRVVLKITGEALKGKNSHFDREKLKFIADEIRSVHELVNLAIVLGGGNIVRGRTLIGDLGTTPTTADHAGMIATVLNALLVEDFLHREGIDTRLMSAIPCDTVSEKYVFKRALRHLERGRVVILAGGTGNCGVTTDTAAILRAYDLRAERVLKGTKVDGVYSEDPLVNPDAKLFPSISYNEFLLRNLSGILDETAISEAKAKKISIHVFNIFKQGNLFKAIRGKSIGSIIS